MGAGLWLSPAPVMLSCGRDGQRQDPTGKSIHEVEAACRFSAFGSKELDPRRGFPDLDNTLLLLISNQPR
jgi:hypothetical protein